MAGTKVTFVVQQEPIGADAEAHRLAVRGMLGACILGALEHYGRADHRRNDTSSLSEVRLSHLDRVLWRNDKGVHGHAFEWAVHSAINQAPGIPSVIARRVQSDISAHAGVMFERLGVPWTNMGDGIRSVMYGVERYTGHRDGHQNVCEELGPGALLWPRAGDEPISLTRFVPQLGLPASRRHRMPGVTPANDLDRLRQPNVPDNIAHLWRTDLFIGGASVRREPELLALTDGALPTAWLAASLKYAPGKLEGGSGLHLGVDTNSFRSDRSDSELWADGLRLIRLRTEDDFLVVFLAAWRLLRHMAAEQFPKRAHPAKFDPQYSGLVAELGRSRSAIAHDYALSLLESAPVVSINTQTVEPGAWPSPVAPAVPILSPVPSLIDFAA